MTLICVQFGFCLSFQCPDNSSFIFSNWTELPQTLSLSVNREFASTFYNNTLFVIGGYGNNKIRILSNASLNLYQNNHIIQD